MKMQLFPKTKLARFFWQLLSVPSATPPPLPFLYKKILSECGFSLHLGTRTNNIAEL